MGEGQAIILLLIIMQIAFIFVATIGQVLETKKVNKNKSNATIKRKWLECAYECEVR